MVLGVTGFSGEVSAASQVASHEKKHTVLLSSDGVNDIFLAFWGFLFFA